MTPMFFGSGTAQKFAALHRPAPGDNQAPAVLLCSPFGEEAIRIHRSFRILSEKLAQAGCHVLRFDYRGAGDSAGDDGDLSLASMAADIRDAHEELMDISATRRVVWVGLRLGAAAALNAAMEKKTAGLVKLILWDPVFDGAAHLAELDAMHIGYLADSFDAPVNTIKRQVGSTQGEEALGFHLSKDLRDQLAALNFRSVDKRPVRNIAIFGDKDPMTETVGAALQEAGVTLSADTFSDTTAWNSDKALNEFVVPTKTIDNIVKAVTVWR